MSRPKNVPKAQAAPFVPKIKVKNLQSRGTDTVKIADFASSA